MKKNELKQFFDFKYFKVYHSGTEERLPPTQQKILEAILDAKDEILDKKKLVEKSVGVPCDNWKMRSFDVHLHHLRKRVKRHGYAIVFRGTNKLEVVKIANEETN